MQALLSASDMIGACVGSSVGVGVDVGAAVVVVVVGVAVAVAVVVAIVGIVVTQPTANTAPATSAKQVRSFLSMASSSLDFRMELSIIERRKQNIQSPYQRCCT